MSVGSTRRSRRIFTSLSCGCPLAIHSPRKPEPKSRDRALSAWPVRWRSKLRPQTERSNVPPPLNPNLGPPSLWLPFGGERSPRTRVMLWGPPLREAGFFEVALADTIAWQSVAKSVRMFERARRELPAAAMRAHFHNTRKHTRPRQCACPLASRR